MPVILGMLGKSAVSFGLNLITSLATEAFIKWAFFKTCKAVVESTATPHDDEWLKAVEKAYENYKNTKGL